VISVTKKYLLGIDGGGTKCQARLIDRDHKVLGEGLAGSSNLSQMGEKALDSILEAAMQAFKTAGISLNEMINTAVGLGISGAELPGGEKVLEQWQHPFASLVYGNDALIACLGAHLGEKGAVLSVGTGIVGWENLQQHSIMRGGWGFPLSDIGSGAWLGLRALQETLKADDGIIPHSPLTQHLLDEHKTAREISAWAFSARSGEFGKYAKVVAQYCAQSDPVAHRLVAEQVCEVEAFLSSIIERQPPRISLLGGMADFLVPMIRGEMRDKLSPALGDALTGALLLIDPDFNYKGHPPSFLSFSDTLDT
jgi:glucosamine kinase